MRPRSPLTGYALVLLAATLWGTLGVTYRLLLGRFPLSPVGLATVRAGLAFVLLVVLLALLRPALLRVHWRDVPYLALFGAISVGAFYVLYAEAIARSSVATAVVLLYTAPAWVALLAWRFFREPLGRRTLLALAATFVGCALVAGVGQPATLVAGVPAVLAGLGSGLTYGLYTIFGKRALSRHDPRTVLVYVLGIGAGLLATAETLAGQPIVPAVDPGGWVALLFIAAGPTLGALAAYTEGLRRLPASVASILSTWEPVVASLLGYLVLGEGLSPTQLAGAGLILAAVISMRLPTAQPPAEPGEGGGPPPRDCRK